MHHLASRDNDKLCFDFKENLEDSANQIRVGFILKADLFIRMLETTIDNCKKERPVSPQFLNNSVFKIIKKYNKCDSKK